MRQAPRHAARAVDAGPRHVPQRTCVGCRRTRPRSQLLRLVIMADTVRVDDRQRLPGRGAYVCPDAQCVDVAARHDGRAVHRALRGGTPQQVLTALDAARTRAAAAGQVDGTHHEEHTA